MLKLKHFELAQKLSRKSSYHHKVGAIIVKKNRVVGVGYNKPNKTHPRSTNAYKTIHAELDAILDCSRSELEDSDIYVFREGCSQKPRLAKPCEHCQRLIEEVGIARVFYSDNESFSYYEVSNGSSSSRKISS